jgi:uncharacterized membrane protein (UPF0127 family)
MRKAKQYKQSKEPKYALAKMLRYNNKVVASKIVYCDNLWCKGTGLMFRAHNAIRGKAWVFTFKTSRRIAVTMLFVFYPIDIIFLDEKNRVIEIVKSLKPFTSYTSRRKSRTFIELDNGTISKYRMMIGSKIYLA